MEAVQLVNHLSIEKELQIYKNLVNKLGFGFTYYDEESKMQMHKDRESKVVNLTYSFIKPDKDIELDIKVEEDIPFEAFESFLNPILDVVPHHITFIDDKGIVTLCNKQTAIDLGFEREAIIGKSISQLLSIADEDIYLLESLKTKTDIKNKEVMDVNYGIINTKVIKDTDDSIKRVIGSFQHLNQIKEVEKKAVAGRIAAGIAHEIRNPLTTVKGFLQVLSESLDKDYSELIRHLLIPEIDRANRIISDFLRVARPEKLKVEKFDIYEFFHSLKGLFYGDAMLRNIRLSADFEQLKGVMITGSKDELTQVFLNLFRNSQEAMPQGLAISARGIKLNDTISITFTDNGPGIPTLIQRNIFDPFFTTKEEGTGLGLSVSRKIIENHGGKMSLKSCKQLTTFKIELPIEE